MLALTSNSCGRGCAGRGSRGPTILKLGVTGRTHSTAQCAGTIVSTSLLRSAGASGSKECSLLARCSAPSVQNIRDSIMVHDASAVHVVHCTPKYVLLPSQLLCPSRQVQASDHVRRLPGDAPGSPCDANAGHGAEGLTTAGEPGAGCRGSPSPHTPSSDTRSLPFARRSAASTQFSVTLTDCHRVSSLTSAGRPCS